VHQASELRLKLAGSEVDQATGLLEGDQIAPALRLLRRALLCLQ
jgi:tryptophan 2,3-dioxygenase